jgi:hypothetical protein
VILASLVYWERGMEATASQRKGTTSALKLTLSEMI